MCRDLGILLVAEGIETEAEKATLIELGCDLLQGFLIGPPQPVSP
jgi:EAL domain-containing protein (putative c-di-GMP-specific phosphodiesterase class I)